MLFLRLFFGCLIQVLPFAVISLYPFMGQYRMSNKKSLLTTAILLTSLSLLFSLITLYLQKTVLPEHLFNITNLVFLCCLIPCLVWYLYLVKGIWQKKLFVFMFTLISAISMTSLNNSVSTMLMVNSETDHLPYRGVSMLVLIAVTAVTVPLLLLILKKEFIPMSDFFSKREYGYLCGLSGVLFTALASGLIPIEYTYLNNPMTVYLYLILLISVFLIYLVVFRMFHIAQKRMLAEQKASRYEAQITVQAEQYQKLMEQISETRRIRHNLRYQLIAIRQYITEGDQEKLLSYVDEQIQNIDSLVIGQFCENETINALLSYYCYLAEEKKIKMTASVSCNKELNISAPELSVLLGNLLENALYASEHAVAEFRYITLNILQKGNIIAFTVDNGFNGKVNLVNGSYASVKEDHVGFGLDSVLKITEEHNGNAIFDHDNFVFHSSVAIQL